MFKKPEPLDTNLLENTESKEAVKPPKNVSNLGRYVGMAVVFVLICFFLGLYGETILYAIIHKEEVKIMRHYQMGAFQNKLGN